MDAPRLKPVSDVRYEASNKAPSAPKAAPRVGVAYPDKIDPKTAKISKIGGSIAIKVLRIKGQTETPSGHSCEGARVGFR